MISGFAPVVANAPKAIILGSMPSVVSLEKRQYYGFKHNRFWKIIAAYFNCEFLTYEDKMQCILTHHLILWDVIASCEREGSLDAKIKNVALNDIEGLLKKYPTVKTVLCNGKKSYELYMRYFSHLNLTCICLPSTSNANRTIKEEELCHLWEKALNQALK